MFEHGPDLASWFVRGVWPKCVCGYAPRDNAALNQHWHEHGLAVHEDHRRLVVTNV